VAIIGIILTTILGTLLGVGRFSRNALVRGLCYAYVEFFRNVPVLLQLLMWYLLLTEVLPASQDAWSLGALLSEQGRLSLSDSDLGDRAPVGRYGPGGRRHAGLVVPPLGLRGSSRPPAFAQHVLGTSGHLLWWACWLVHRRRCAVGTSTSPKGDFSIENGGSLTPEFLAVLLGLTIYTAAFVAEVVRAGISRCRAARVKRRPRWA
jgi:general L-amino acid transport system permease protein